MIKLLRLDDRLIHGQIATKWARVLGVDRIIVINDDAASNKIVRQSLMMAAPPQCKTAIKSVADAVELLKNPKAQEHAILLLVGNPQDCLAVIERVSGIEKVNIGNYGLLTKDGAIRRKLNDYCRLSDEEISIIKAIADKGIAVEFRIIPDDRGMSFQDAVNNGR